MSVIPFTGKLGPLIGYKRNGQYFLRSMPESVRQTAATRRASRRFGLHIPAQTIAGYKSITALEVKVIATRIDFRSRQLVGSETVMLMLDPDTFFEETNISLDVPGEDSLEQCTKTAHRVTGNT